MASAASSSAILSPNPTRAFAAKAHAPMAVAVKPFSQTLNLSSNFNGIRKSFQSPLSLSSRRTQSSKRSFVVRASVCVLVLICYLFCVLI